MKYIIRKLSFDKVKNYYVETIKNMCKKGIKIILLGNKTDLNNQRQVSDVDGKDLAEENGYMFMESSCKDNYNVSDAFTALVEMTNKEIYNGTKNNMTISIDKDNGKDNSSCC